MSEEKIEKVPCEEEKEEVESREEERREETVEVIPVKKKPWWKFW